MRRRRNNSNNRSARRRLPLARCQVGNLAIPLQIAATAISNCFKDWQTILLGEITELGRNAVVDFQGRIPLLIRITWVQICDRVMIGDWLSSGERVILIYKGDFIIGGIGWSLVTGQKRWACDCHIVTLSLRTKSSHSDDVIAIHRRSTDV